MNLILKTSLGLGLGVGLVALVAPSYLGTAVDGVVRTCKNQVPLEFEIERASGLIRKVEPQIDACKREVAQAEVNLENLETDLVVLADKLVANEAKLKQGAALLGGGGALATAASLGGASLARASLPAESPATRDRVALNLKRSFEAFKNERALLATKQKLRERQRAAADAARARLDAVRAEKARLEDMVASLRVQKAQVDALAATSPNVQLDDSALGEAKQVLAEIKNRLDVTQKMLEDDMFFVVGGVGLAGPTEPPVQAELVLAEIRDFMASNPEK